MWIVVNTQIVAFIILIHTYNADEGYGGRCDFHNTRRTYGQTPSANIRSNGGGNIYV